MKRPARIIILISMAFVLKAVTICIPPICVFDIDTGIYLTW
jgi:hypothetical protein